MKTNVRNEEAFNKKNFSGTPIDRVRSTVCRMIIDSTLSGKAFEDARMEAEATVYAQKTDLRVNKGMSEDEITWALEGGISLARMALGVNK